MKRQQWYAVTESKLNDRYLKINASRKNVAFDSGTRALKPTLSKASDGGWSHLTFVEAILSRKIRLLQERICWSNTGGMALLDINCSAKTCGHPKALMSTTILKNVACKLTWDVRSATS